MRRLNVLYLPHPQPQIARPWGQDVLEAISAYHHVKVFDPALPAEGQFEGIEAVVDLGGNIQDDLINVAARAGVRFLQAQTNGLDHVKVDEILTAGITLAHCPGHLSSVALAESAMMFILVLAKRYDEACANFARGHFYAPIGQELAGLTLGIVGFGAAGQELARRARAFDMRIVTNDIRTIEPEILDEIQPDFIGGADDLDHVVAESDYLSLHLHLTQTTRHILDARRIALMKSTACVINVSRGGLADEDALYEALLAGHLRGAGLDVFDKEPPDLAHPVYALSNVCVTPHVGGGTDGTSRKRAAFAATNLDRWAKGEPLEAQVR